jgi:hypothetical protein
MDFHSGTWTLTPTDVSDLIFSSASAVTVILTVRWTGFPYAPVSLTVQVNGTAPANGTLSGPAGEAARTFRLTPVNTIHLVASGNFVQFSNISGDYQITVL